MAKFLSPCSPASEARLIMTPLVMRNAGIAILEQKKVAFKLMSSV
jgi:hypothetical protein